MAIFKRGKIWWMRFSVNGKPYRESTKVTNRALAEKIYAKVLTQITEEKWFDYDKGTKTTFNELMVRYFEVHIPTKAIGSQRRDNSLRAHLESFFGTCTLNAISPGLISEYKAKRKKTGISPSSLNRELALMKHAYTLASGEWELCRDNPVKRVSMEKENNARDRWLRAQEEEKLLSVSDKWLCEVILFALNTGMRIEEILSLKWDNVYLNKSILTVIKAKNGEKRTIPLNSIVVNVLKELSKVRHINCPYVFTSVTGTKLDQGNVRRAFIKARAKVGLDDVKIHDLRHTFATRLVQSGIDLYKVQRLLGHKTPLMTQRYAHHYHESLRDAVVNLEGVQN